MENIKLALEKAKEIIDYHLSELGDNTSASTILSILLFVKGIDVGCECDDYNAFDCGCGDRSRIIKLALDELEKIKT